MAVELTPGAWVVGGVVCVDGARVGLWVRRWVGRTVGIGVGCIVGERVGSGVGGWVGRVVGTPVGEVVGASVGIAVGAVVGRWVGAVVGGTGPRLEAQFALQPVVGMPAHRKILAVFVAVIMRWCLSCSRSSPAYEQTYLRRRKCGRPPTLAACR